MYGSHPLGTVTKREVTATASRASSGAWRTEARRSPVTRTRTAKRVLTADERADRRRSALYGF